MTHLKTALESLVSGTNNFCCLCLNIHDIENLICSKDETCIAMNNNEDNIVMSDLITTILGSDFSQYVETLENICSQCAKSLISCYNFIKTCNLNATFLTKAVDTLNTGIHNITIPEKKNSLFVSINLDNFSSRVLYDTEKNFTLKVMALERFQALIAPKIKEVPKITSKHKNYTIKDSDMLHDPNKHHIFQCKVCLKMYQSMSNLRNHYTRVHTEINDKPMHPKTNQSKAEMTKKTTKNQNKITCDECGRTYNNLHSLQMHQMGHLNTLVCPDCGRTYKNKSTFKNHVQLNICKQERRHSPAQAKYTCDYCSKKYTQKMSLRVHIQFEHGNYKAHICEWCGKKFWAQSRLKAHIVKHTRERNFTCPICNRNFVTKTSLLYHTRLHTGEKPYKCPECCSTFLSASRRSDHVKRYHAGAKPGLECDVCHGKFRSGDFLLKHKKIHEEKINNAAKMYTIPQKETIFV